MLLVTCYLLTLLLVDKNFTDKEKVGVGAVTSLTKSPSSLRSKSLSPTNNFTLHHLFSSVSSTFIPFQPKLQPQSFAILPLVIISNLLSFVSRVLSYHIASHRIFSSFSTLHKFTSQPLSGVQKSTTSSHF